MAKYYNNQKKTGKVAGSVFAIRGGETIERAYNPVVANPSTEAQVEARAKLKLLSQLAAVVAPVLTLRPEGNVTKRNVFISKNYNLATFANNQADVPLASLDITGGVVSLPLVYANRGEGQVTAQLSEAGLPLNVNRVVYTFFVKTDDSKLRYLTSAVATEPGVNNNWGVTVEFAPSREILILAYGVRDNTEAASVMFGNIEVMTAETVAKLVVTRRLTESDVTLTETRGVTIAALG